MSAALYSSNGLKSYRFFYTGMMLAVLISTLALGASAGEAKELRGGRELFFGYSVPAILPSQTPRASGTSAPTPFQTIPKLPFSPPPVVSLPDFTIPSITAFPSFSPLGLASFFNSLPTFDPTDSVPVFPSLPSFPDRSLPDAGAGRYPQLRR